MNAPLLLVNGSPDLRRHNREVLENAGYPVVEATSSDRAVELARAALPRVVLVDASGTPELPLRVARRLRNHPRTAHIPILILSPQAQPEHSRELEQLSDVRCLQEPLGGRWLLEEVQSLALRSPQASAFSTRE